MGVCAWLPMRTCDEVLISISLASVRSAVSRRVSDIADELARVCGYHGDDRWLVVVSEVRLFPLVGHTPHA